MKNKEDIPTEILEAFNQIKGYSLIVRGAPGSGKTTFALELLKKYIEGGVYFTTRSAPKALYRQYPWLKNIVYKDNILDPIQSYVSKEIDISEAFEYRYKPELMKTIYDSVANIKNATIVIDNWYAVTEQTEELRKMAEIELIDAIRGLDANLVIVLEQDKQTSLDYPVDAVVVLNKENIEGRCVRELRLNKLRGFEIKQSVYLFTLFGGRFQSFDTFKYPKIEKYKRFISVPDSKTHFSTGNKDLNEMLEHGYPRGSYVFIEVGKDVDYATYFLIPILAVANFVTLGRGVSIIPVSGKSPENIKYEASRYGIENEVNSLIKVSANSLKKDFQNWNEMVLNLKEKTGESVLRLIGYDTMEALFGRSALSEIISLEAQSISDNKDLGIAIGKDSTPETNKILADIAEIHLKIEKRNRVLIIYGKKPETGIYAVTPDISNGYPDIKLTPIV
ncbi:MAG TPA: hypothetical protein EYP22_04820 [Methanosarcinales archaeon]|nr:hypothetical protein [Methanosarcinales archaeon]